MVLMALGESEYVFNGKFPVIRSSARQRKGAFVWITDPLHSFESRTGVPFHVRQ